MYQVSDRWGTGCDAQGDEAEIRGLFFREHFSRTVDRSLFSPASIETAVGPLFQTIEAVLSDGTPFSWELIAPAALLIHLWSTSRNFSSYLEELVTKWCPHLGQTLSLGVAIHFEAALKPCMFGMNIVSSCSGCEGGEAESSCQ